MVGKNNKRIMNNKGKIKEIIEDYKKYAEKSGFKLNPNQAIVENLVKGLLKNEEKYGVRYCPCRRITGNLKEDQPKICPCKWHKEEIKKNGRCYCGLFEK